MADRIDEKRLAEFVGELGHLAALPRADFFKAGVAQPATLGYFTTLAAQFAFLITAAEGRLDDAPRAATMALFSMLPNARLLTVDYLAQPFMDYEGIRARVVEKQLEEAPAEAAEALRQVVTEYEEHNSLIARYAYEGYRLASAYLDAFYSKRGCSTGGMWISNAAGAVESEFGKALLRVIEQGRFEDWCLEKAGKHGGLADTSEAAT